MSDPPPTAAEDPLLCLVDVGARGGLQPKWHPYGGMIRTVMFEPDHDEAARLRATHGPEHSVIERALFDADGRHEFHRTRNPLCASLRRPNDVFLSRYEIRGHFEIEATFEVDCVRYDTLYHAGEVPVPDAIKVDVVGTEYEVLLGFGDVAARCLGIETQAHLYPIYQDEKLLHDIVALLARKGLMLRRLEHLGQFDGDFVVVNAYFTPPRDVVRRFSPERRHKFDLLTQVWELPSYPG
jgi:FkbM family methyltransferase